MAFPNLDQHPTHAIRAYGCVLAGISTFAGSGRERRPFLGQIVDQRIFREPPRQIFVDAAQAEEVAGAAILHLGVEQGRRGSLTVLRIARSVVRTI